MNRGVALGIAVLIGFAIYIQVDKAQFANAKPEITEMLTNYINEFCTLSVTDEAHRSVNTDYTDKEIRDMQAKYRAAMDQYWIEVPENPMTWEPNYDVIQSYIASYLHRMKDEPRMGYITDNKSVIKSITLKKSGPLTAQATVKYESIVKLCGATPFFSVCDYDYLGEAPDDAHVDFGYSYNDSGIIIEKWEYSVTTGNTLYYTKYDENGKAIYTEKYDEQGSVLDKWDGEKPDSEKVKIDDSILKEATVTHSGDICINLKKSNGSWYISSMYNNSFNYMY